MYRKIFCIVNNYVLFDLRIKNCFYILIIHAMLITITQKKYHYCDVVKKQWCNLNSKFIMIVLIVRVLIYIDLNF